MIYADQESEDHIPLHDAPQPLQTFYLHGLPLWTVSIGLCLGLFLTCLEVSIVSTSLVTITNELHGFDEVGWVITSYLLTYTGFLMIWSKCGDIFGVKHSLLCSLTFFIAFSGGCGAAQSLNQLIICRAFQGIGGAGAYSLTLFSLLRLVPRERYDLITAITAAIMSGGLVLGPLAGGAIDTSGAWRWIFLLNIPGGAVAWILLVIAMPDHYPNPPPEVYKSHMDSATSTFMRNQRAFFQRVDFLGAFLVLAASMLMIAALQEGNLQYAWSSPLIVSLLVVSACLWLCFLAWEWFSSHRYWKIEPMLPWRLAKNRIYLGVAFGFFLTGVPLTVCVIQLPQRYQTVNGLSPFEAGVRLLAYALANPIGGFICSGAAGRLKTPFIYILLTGIVLQTGGIFLISETPTTPTELGLGQFGYAVVAGLGVGMAVAAVYMMVPLVVEERDQSIALGMSLQLRMLGGALGIAIVTTILNSHLKSQLPSVLQPEQVSAVLDSAQTVATFPPDVQIQVLEFYAEGYNRQMKAAGAFSVAQFFAAGLLWKKDQVRFLRDAQDR